MRLFQALRGSEKENGDCRNNTTLKMHFFGSRGTGQLTFNQFSKYCYCYYINDDDDF